MIRLLFVGDGERDAAMNPHLVRTITGIRVEPTARPWARLNAAGRGYECKLLFAIRDARDRQLDGVVATVDQDKSRGRDRLRELVAARAKDREYAAPLPTAVGVANPHAEAWLLDDPVAVRTALGLGTGVQIPNVRTARNPKSDLNGLQSMSERRDEPVRTVLADIARSVDPRRCQHARETGFAAFVDDVRSEIGSLATQD